MVNNFESHTEEGKPVIIDFFGEWSEPCKLMTPVLHQLRETVGDRATIMQVDIDKNPEYAALYGVTSVPTILIFKDANIIWRKNGVVAASEILHHLNQYIS